MNAGYKTELTDLLGMRYPIIMAPMFLVSNAEMTIAAINSGITGSIPAHNYRNESAMREALEKIKSEANGPLGINLATNKSNYHLKWQLKACIDCGVDYIITSLGKPDKIIEACKENDIKILSDVIGLKHAAKVVELGVDALIAVNSEAGGHLGPMKPQELIPLLNKEFDLPVVSAGGVGNGQQLLDRLEMGSCGASIGSPFIATNEAPVSQEYKQACVDYGAKDIVVSTKISGTPCTVINTPYVQKIGTKQNGFEAFLAKNRQIRKWIKMITFLKGMKSLEKAAFKATYKSVWCAGPSIEYVEAVRPVKEVVETFVNEFEDAVAKKKDVLTAAHA